MVNFVLEGGDGWKRDEETCVVRKKLGFSKQNDRCTAGPEGDHLDHLRIVMIRIFDEYFLAIFWVDIIPAISKEASLCSNWCNIEMIMSMILYLAEVANTT